MKISKHIPVNSLHVLKEIHVYLHMTQSIGNKSNEKGQFKTIVNLTQKIIKKNEIWNIHLTLS